MGLTGNAGQGLAWQGTMSRVRKLLSTTSHVTLVRLHNGAICMPCALHAARQQTARACHITQMLSTTHAQLPNCPPYPPSNAVFPSQVRKSMHQEFSMPAFWSALAGFRNLRVRTWWGRRLGDGGSSGRGCPKAFRPGTSGTLRSAVC